MPIINRIAGFHDDMTAWRRDIHAHPETAFEERRTSDFVAKKLGEFGIEVHRGLAGTGVIGTLRAGTGRRSIGLRADMDALHIHEKNGFAHASTTAGKMHACGHDGHTTMLLGAAKYLAETRNFDGVVHFIFQPAEENEGGGRVMVEQGLFDKFPVEAVYGMHNMPDLAAGRFAIRPGPMMASYDVFEIAINGKGAHAAMPHQGVDPVVVAASVVTSLQSIVSRTVNPVDAVVVSVTQIHGGDAWNVIPDDVVLRGTCRCFRPEVQQGLEASIRRIAEGVCAAFGARMTMRYEIRYPALVNDGESTERAARIAEDIVGPPNVSRERQPTMGSEDFAFMLQAKKGAYIFIGNGKGGVDSCMLHNPHYDFNDDILPLGASYWARMVELSLPKS
ncbi:MAG TPA: M20 aminoacylase family protein [Alphaproteobacteria bacterium]|nr:M20 aminoacylase family protein [Alphaproteobacteria bacterium]